MPPETTGFGQQADRRPGLHPPPPPSWCGEPRDAIRRDGSAPSIRGVCGFDGGVNVEEGDGADDVEEAGYGGGGGGDAQVGALMGGEDPMTPSPTCVFLRQGRIGGAPRSVRTGGSPANAGCAATACTSCSRPEELGLSEDALDRVSGRGDRSG